jgi:hypothetical protein
VQRVRSVRIDRKEFLQEDAAGFHDVLPARCVPLRHAVAECLPYFSPGIQNVEPIAAGEAVGHFGVRVVHPAEDASHRHPHIAQGERIDLETFRFSLIRKRTLQ